MNEENRIDVYQIGMAIGVTLIIVGLIFLGSVIVATITADNMCQILGYDTSDIDLWGLLDGNYIKCNYATSLEQIIQ